MRLIRCECCGTDYVNIMTKTYYIMVSSCGASGAEMAEASAPIDVCTKCMQLLKVGPGSQLANRCNTLLAEALKAEYLMALASAPKEAVIVTS